MQSRIQLKKFALILCSPLLLINSSLSAAVTPSVEFLYWQPSQQSSSSWATTISSGTTSGAKTKDIHETNVNFRYTPGLRIGLEKPLPDSWSMGLSWTFLESKAKRAIAKPSKIIIPEFFSGFLSGNFFFNANLDWKLQLQSFDWDLGKSCQINPDILLRPAIGIKGSMIRQNIDTLWNAFIYESTEAVKHHYYGLGPYLKLSSQWDLVQHPKSNVRLLGEFQAALMQGKWLVKDVYTRPAVPASLVSATTITTQLSKMHLGTGVFSFLIGLEWTYEASYETKVKLGYEMQLWTNQLRIPTFQELPTHGNLTFQGVTCGVTILF